jgi:hypothetical protein
MILKTDLENRLGKPAWKTDLEKGTWKKGHGKKKAPGK